MDTLIQEERDALTDLVDKIPYGPQGIVHEYLEQLSDQFIEDLATKHVDYMASEITGDLQGDMIDLVDTIEDLDGYTCTDYDKTQIKYWLIQKQREYKNIARALTPEVFQDMIIELLAIMSPYPSDPVRLWVSTWAPWTNYEDAFLDMIGDVLITTEDELEGMWGDYNRVYYFMPYDFIYSVGESMRHRVTAAKDELEMANAPLVEPA